MLMKASSISLLLVALLHSTIAVPTHGVNTSVCYILLCSCFMKLVYIIMPQELLLHIQYTGSCPDGSYPVNCLINPCQYATCPAVEGATCVADYCGGCNARWLLNGQEVTSQCEGELLSIR